MCSNGNTQRDQKIHKNKKISEIYRYTNKRKTP